MAVILKEVAGKKDLKEFIYLPEKIHKDQKNWLPPIYFDEKKFFDPKKNLSFRGCDHILILAYKDEKPVGRIMGIINHNHNGFFQIKNGRFAYFDCFNDAEVSKMLLNRIENWAKQKGMNKIIGPYGFTDRDPQGLLIKGFEYEPVVDSATNPEYLPELVSKEGYEKELDCLIHRYPLSNEVPELYHRIFQRILLKKELQFLEFTKRKQLKRLIVPVLKAVNESFKDIYGFMPMDEKEMYELAKRYLPILNPKFVKIVTKGDKVVAFLISMPNLYKGIQMSKGRLLPFGIFHILRAMRTAKTINTMLGGVDPEYQKQGLDVFLFMTTLEAAKKAGMTSIDTHVVMEDNKDMMAETKRYGSFEIKRFRVFQKQL
jgi:hypothetical protein